MKRALRRIVSRLKANALLRRSVSRLRTISLDPQMVSLGRAGQLIENGNYNQAAACLEKAGAKKPRAWKALLNSYLAAHRFKELCTVYESMPDGCRQDLGCRRLYLLAAANLKRFDLVQRVMDDVLNEPDSDRAAEFLSGIFLFTESLGQDSRQQVIDRIVSHRSWLVREQFDALLKCTHHLRGRGRDDEATLLEQSLRTAATGDRNRTKLDVYEGQVSFLEGHYDRQLAAVNRVLKRQMLDPIDLNDASIPFTCENLKAATSTTVRGPLVSILMPAYNSAETIGYALESLRGQTYQDFEVIVVDDASSDNTLHIVKKFSELDSRFRVISLQRNSGAFVARNEALARAAGEFVTNQDADDWAHPQKIASAVAELVTDRSLIATWVEHVRCSRERGFRALSGYIRPDASSLMFRREPVMNRIGWYDSVRAAGDGEFHLRLERAFGRHSIRQIDKLLSFVRWSDTSLSGGGTFQIDSELGIFSSARSEYRREFGLWHETADRLYMPFPLKDRPFPVPESLWSVGR